MSTYSSASSREAHEKAKPKKELLYQLILAAAKTYGFCDPITMSTRTGIPVTSLRPRFTELSDADYCREHFNTRPKLKHIGRVVVDGARCRVTAFAINAPRTSRPCSSCEGWGTYESGAICPACCGSGEAPPQIGMGGRDGLD